MDKRAYKVSSNRSQLFRNKTRFFSARAAAIIRCSLKNQVLVFSTAINFAAIFAHEAQADDRRIDKTQVTIMHLNAEFMWDGVAPEEGQPSIHFDWRGSPVEAAAHMQAVAAIINRNNPD